ncbi:TetR/AcrR family transcriptional regulator [Nocardioides humilatus]|uniref:TetR/AcrR family transcriptional regulator n=1 Tax=Nocardioides humilatus TaxID=2607660 RepID=A0A5B1L8R0_9ACTN|nr:TetR/AcrR family transcriptional regulator [Nocardioides humilatus]KAA1416975.1 TetR/AcrR family transcriptional regulator [Nocardioides humilatus]
MTTPPVPEGLVESPTEDPTATKILDAALAEFTDFGIRRVSVDNIAARAGVHRTTVYRYFSTKAEILQASAVKWLHDTFSTIYDEIQTLPPDERVVEGFARAVGACYASPLTARVLGSDTDAGLRSLTVDAGPVIGMVSAVFVHWLWEGDESGSSEDAAGTAEVLVRLGLSFVLTPDSHFDMRSPDVRRDFARRYLLPLMTVL